MREILFRGKRKTNGEWIYGDYFRSKIFNTEFGTRVVHSITYYHNNTEHTYCVDPETVGQYTGLTDKNGKKIFEGDILFCADATSEYSLILIRDEGWGCSLDYYFGGESYDSELVKNDDWLSDCKVIGNIYDNPELLEVGE